MSTSTHNPLVDNAIESLSTTTNHGTDPVLPVGWSGGGMASKYRALLRFDLRAISRLSTLSGATLTLKNTTTGSEMRTNGVYYCRRLTQVDWTEAGSTWAKYDGSTNWTGAGSDYTATDQATASIAAATSDVVFSDVSALVTDALENRFGWLDVIVMSDESSAGADLVQLHSSEAASSANYPALVLTGTIINNPVKERIALEVHRRLDRITTARGYAFDAVVSRPTRIGGWAPKDKSVVLFQGDCQYIEVTEGNPGLIHWIQTFGIGVLAIESDTSTNPIHTLINVREAETHRALVTCIPSETGSTDWAKFNGMSFNAEFGDAEDLPFPGFSGTAMRLDVEFRHPENDPYTPVG
jgi:hypothetical protein